MARWSIIALLIGCTPTESTCGEGEVLVDGVCQSADSGDTGDDTGTTQPPKNPNAFSRVTIEFDVERLPNDLEVQLLCDDRVVYSEDLFTFEQAVSESVDVLPDELCDVVFSDARGGELPGGRIIVCSEEVATFDAGRSPPDGVRTIEDVLAFECIPGCADPIAENHDPETNLDDGSCEYIDGCTDPDAVNYDATATRNDGTCDFGGFGPMAVTVFTDDGPRDTVVRVYCQGSLALEFGKDNRWSAWSTVRTQTVVDGGYTCEVEVEDTVGDAGPSGAITVCDERVLAWGRLESEDLAWRKVVGTFKTQACSGCTDPVAQNFDDEAVIDDGSCIYP